MKQIRIIIAVVLFTALSLNHVSAAGVKDSASEVPVELAYMGNVNNQYVFQLNFSGSEDENEFSIIISDDNGYVFYDKKVKGEKFTKQFLLNTETLSDANIQFAITGKKSGKTVVYKVDRQSKIIEQMNIVKF